MTWRAALAAAAMIAGAARADFEIGSKDWAPVPRGGTSWTILTATEALPWTGSDGVTHLAPQFPAAVTALEGRSVRIAGFLVSQEEDGAPVRHFALYASRIDCELHLPPGPAAYIDVTSDLPQAPTSHPLIIEGKLELVHARQGGVFYRIRHARAVLR